MPQTPKLDPARGHRGRGVTVLPATGRPGDPPPWPLAELLLGEADTWAQLWASPQAAAWERLGCTRTVARYCRALVVAEASLLPALLAQVTALEDRLGLTPKAMRLLLWTIGEPEDPATPAPTTHTARGRIRAVS